MSPKATDGPPTRCLICGSSLTDGEILYRSEDRVMRRAACVADPSHAFLMDATPAGENTTAQECGRWTSPNGRANAWANIRWWIGTRAS
jgi:hypothetical protein